MFDTDVDDRLSTFDTVDRRSSRHQYRGSTVDIELQFCPHPHHVGQNVCRLQVYAVVSTIYHLTNLSSDDEVVKGNVLMSGRLLPLRSSPVAVISTFRMSPHLRPWQRYRPALTQSFCYRLLLLPGDVEANPGPVKFPCGICSHLSGLTRQVSNVMCDYWLHKWCMSMSDSEYEFLQHSDEPWCCPPCLKEALPFHNCSTISTISSCSSTSSLVS